MEKSQILETIEKMTVLELSELVKAMEDKFGVTAAAPMGMAMPVAGPAAAAVEKTEFDVVLEAIGPQKIQVIKVVRELTGLGLKEAKDLVEAAPKAIKEGASKADGEAMKKKIEDVGGKAALK